MKYPKYRLMMVDDQPHSLFLLGQLFQGEPYDIYKFTSPLEALEELPALNIDLILLDMAMPEMDGLQFLRAVKQSSMTSDIPVMLLTGKVFTSDEEARAYMLHADDYITKPFRTPLLKKRVASLVKVRRAEQIMALFSKKREGLSSHCQELLDPFLDD